MKSEKIYEAIGGIDEKWITLADAPLQKKEQRHFVAYEFKKLLGVKYLWVFLGIFILLNSAIAWYTADKSTVAGEPTQLISEFFAQYSLNPEELDAHYAEILRFNQEQNVLMHEAFQSGNYDYVPETMPSIYSDDESYPDQRLFAKLYETIEAARNYPEIMQMIIDRAKANLAEFTAMGLSEDSFTYKYQSRVIELYELTRDNVQIDVGYSRGWNEYFDYDMVNVFQFIMLIMLASLIFAQEKQTGFLPIIRAAKHGRLRTAFAKITVTVLLSMAFTLLFTMTTWAVYGVRIGFSSPTNALQSLSEFTLSPYQINIGQYFAISIGVKLLTFALFSLLILALSAVFYNYILIYLSGLGLFGLNFLLYTLTYINANSPLKNLNLVAVSAANPLFVRYRAVNLFGNVWGYVPFMLTVFTLLLVSSAVMTSVLYVRGINEIRIGWIDTMISNIMIHMAKIKTRLVHSSVKHKENRKIRAYSLSLLAAESFKTLISSRFIVVVVLLLCVKLWYSAEINQATNSYSDAVYKEYMITLEGELDDEKLAYLAKERSSIDEILAKQTMMQQAYMEEKITFEEYRDYLSDYNYAYSRSELLTVIEDHASYLQKKQAETGITGHFVYDTGWKKLFNADADLFLYTSILLLLTGSFAAEYASKSSSGGFAQILRSTKNGRNKTFTAKLVSSGIIALMLAILFNAVDTAVIVANYDMPNLTAPLISMQMFSDLTSGISIGVYIGVFFVLRIIGALLMAMLVCALSELLCKYIPILGSVVVLTLLPALLCYFGLKAAEKVSFLSLLAGTPLFIDTMSASFISGWLMLAIWIMAAGAVVVAMLAPAKKMFVR